MVSYYKVLGLDDTASPETVKASFRRLIKIHHSDRHGQNDDPISRLIIEAFDTLNDPRKRRIYDATRASSPSSPYQDPADYSTNKDPAKERCKECDGYGYSKLSGVSWSCRYCEGKGWVPGRKF